MTTIATYRFSCWRGDDGLVIRCDIDILSEPHVLVERIKTTTSRRVAGLLHVAVEFETLLATVQWLNGHGAPRRGHVYASRGWPEMRPFDGYVIGPGDSDSDSDSDSESPNVGIKAANELAAWLNELVAAAEGAPAEPRIDPVALAADVATGQAHPYEGFEPGAALRSFNGDGSTWLVKPNPSRSYSVKLGRPGVLDVPMSRRLIVRLQPTNRRIWGYLVLGRLIELINAAGGDARVDQLLRVMDSERAARKAQSASSGRPYNEPNHARDIIRREARERLSEHWEKGE